MHATARAPGGYEPPVSVRRLHIILTVVVIVTGVVVSSFAHIQASTVPISVSLTDPNPDAADFDFGAFRDDNPFVADVRRTGKCRHGQERNNKKGNTAFFMTLSSKLGRSPSRCSTACALGIPEVCIE